MNSLTVLNLIVTFIAINMKKITNKSLQTALLRGAVIVSGSMLTGIAALFINDFYGVLSLLVVGAGIVCITDEQIKTNLKNKVK
jgi:hypothetical protein